MQTISEPRECNLLQNLSRYFWIGCVNFVSPPQKQNYNFCNQLDNLCYTHIIYRLIHMLVDPVIV